MKAEVIHLNNLDDPRLEAYTRLTERELRNVLEPEKGIFIAESAKVISAPSMPGSSRSASSWPRSGSICSCR